MRTEEQAPNDRKKNQPMYRRRKPESGKDCVLLLRSCSDAGLKINESRPFIVKSGVKEYSRI